MNDEIEILSRRVDRLEASRRRLQIAAGTAGVLAAVPFLVGARPKAAPPRILEAGEVRLVDASGTIRGVFSAASGAPYLALKDAKGKERVRLALAGPAGAELAFAGASGNRAARLSVADDGSVALALADSSGKDRWSASLGADGTPSVALSDGDGNTRASLGLSAEGVAHLRFSEADGRTRASLGSTTLKETHSGASFETDAGTFILFDPSGKTIFKMPR